MQQITVFRTLFSANMGEGWRDDAEACEAFADALDTAFRTYCERYYPETDIDIRITTQRASGASRDVEVVSDLGYREEHDMQEALRIVAERTWDTWTTSAEAEALYRTDSDEA